MIHQLKAEGLNHSQIARRLNLDRKTVRRYLSVEPDDAARVPHRARPSKLDRYRGYLLRRVPEHPRLCAARVRDSIRDPARRTGAGRFFLLSDPLPRGTRAASEGMAVFHRARSQPLPVGTVLRGPAAAHRASPAH